MVVRISERDNACMHVYGVIYSVETPNPMTSSKKLSLYYHMDELLYVIYGLMVELGEKQQLKHGI